MKNFPMLDLKREYAFMKDHIDGAIRKCLDHQQWIMGPEVKELEDNIAVYLGAKHCVGLSSGTDALVLSLRALAIMLKDQEYFDRSDEIITTPFTFTATGDAILRAGATPVFVDIDPVSFNLDPEKVRACLASSRRSHHASRVVGIIPVHLYGQACSMDELLQIAREHEIFMLEDVAQAFGASWGEKKLGTLGQAGAFSFFPSKNLGGFGDAGLIATDDDRMNELIRMLLRHGGKDKYNVNHIGYNARIDTLQAAILLAKLHFIDEFNERRKRIAALYTKELNNMEGIHTPFSSSSSSTADTCHVYHQYTIRVTDGKRDKLQSYLKENSVDSMVYYPYCLHTMRVFQGRHVSDGTLTEAERATREVLSIPIEPLYSEDDVTTIIETIRKFV